MKILLTSDWHLKPRHPYSAMLEGRVWDRMCQEKLDTLYKIPKLAKKLLSYNDEVVIAGDIFDTSNPPEALKAEFIKILSKMPVKTTVITGRPGEHDYVNPQNYVLMDIRQAIESMGNKEEVYIHDSNWYHLYDGTLICHEMLEGINEFYKHTVSMDDERFQDYHTILMGDYHAYYHTTFGTKKFIYPGPPYPTRYGEKDHGFVVVEFDDKSAKYISHKYYKLKTYRLLESLVLKEGECEVPYILRYNLRVRPDEIPVTLRKCEEMKNKLMNKYPNCMDVVWKVSANKEGVDMIDLSDMSIEEVCEAYIQENAPKKFKKSTLKLFKELVRKI